MRPLLNREQIRFYDKLAIEKYRIPSLILMENAGRGAADKIRSFFLSGSKKPNIVILCGTGNNGGDGFVVARHLAEEANVKVLLTGDATNFSKDAEANYTLLQHILTVTIHRLNLGVDGTVELLLKEADIVIDALFGTGLTRAIEGVQKNIIRDANNTNALRVALDIPSGIDADTGAVLGVAFKAHHTLTFAYPKCGLYTPTGKDYAGTIHTLALGVPNGMLLQETGATAHLLEEGDIPLFHTPRSATTYKHRAGDVLIVAGSSGKTGAAQLASLAALRTGAGLSTIAAWGETWDEYANRAAEIMLLSIERTKIKESLESALSKRNSIVVGPGIGLDADAKKVVLYLLEHSSAPLVLDADALTLVAENVDTLKKSPAQKILTPHSGELARLLKTTATAIESNRFAAVKEAARLTNATVVLKGAHTLIADPHTCRVNPFANPLLATAGSGDVLAGMCGALIATMPPLEAASAAVYSHASTAERWYKKTNRTRGMIASDIIDALVGDYH